MASWIKEVPLDQLVEGECYFLAKKWESHGGPSYMFHSRLLSGRVQWSSKPGIAIHCIADEKFRGILAGNENFVALEIPADADKRWTARRRRF